VDTLEPTPLDRLRALARRRPPHLDRARRVLAAACALLAVATALRPPAAGTPVLAAARDLPPGVPLTGADLLLRHVPEELRPRGSLTDPAAVVGRALTGTAPAGEPLNEARLTGPDDGAASVVVPLPDSGVADLLRTGQRVDLVGPDSALAENAVVLSVRVVPDGHVLVALVRRDEAVRVAAASLGEPLAVTLR
jgi:Flp pilus assembly protein CpaB